MPALRGERDLKVSSMTGKCNRYTKIMKKTAIYTALFIGLLPQIGGVRAAPQRVCDLVAQQAAKESGVPLSVMKAITRTETGRVLQGRLTPWPWTVNMEGTGKWFDTRAEAEAYVSKHHARGARSYDVGCFQVNYKWHGHAFASNKAMFDPLTNARYAAQFLSDLFEEMGDWPAAAGAYHSRTPEYAARYTKRFNRIRSRMDATIPAPEPFEKAETPRVNRYPLLQTGTQASRLGSLVPSTQPSFPALISLSGGSPQ